MGNLMEYKGYHASVDYSDEDEVFFGKIAFIKDSVTFHAENAKDLRKEFEAAVDGYIAACQKFGRDPQKPFKGGFNVRIKPELHKNAALAALKRKVSLNKFVETAIAHELGHAHDNG